MKRVFFKALLFSAVFVIFIAAGFGAGGDVMASSNNETKIKGKVLENFPKQIAHDGTNYFVMTDDGKRRIMVAYGTGGWGGECLGNIGPSAGLSKGDSVEVYGTSILSPEMLASQNSSYVMVISVCKSNKHYVL